MEEAARSRSSSRSQLPAKLDSKDTNRIRMSEIYTDLIDAASRLGATFESGIWCEMSFGVVPVRCVVCSRTVRPRPRCGAARHQFSRGKFEHNFTIDNFTQSQR